MPEALTGLPPTTELSVAGAGKDDTRQFVEACVRQRLENCPYSFYYNRVSWRFERGRLILTGIVPSFYIKQMLQTLLKDIQHVRQLENHVDVVSATGLSSERASHPIQPTQKGLSHE